MGSTRNSTGWHEWLCHSHYSFLMGASSPEAIVDEAIRHGYSSLAITDFDGVYGLAKAYTAIKKHRAAGHSLQLHYGTELHLAPDHGLPIMIQNTVALVAKTHRGYSNLCRIITEAQRNGKNNAWINVNAISAYDTTDIIAIVPMRGLLRRHQFSEFDSQLAQLSQTFDDLVMAITITHHMSEDHWIDHSIAMATTRQIPLIVSQDAFFHRAELKPLADVLTAIRLNQPLDNATHHMWPNSQRHLASIAVLHRRYRHLDIFLEAMKRSEELARGITFDFSELRYQYPHEWLPDGLTSHEYLTQITRQHANRYYKDGIPDRVSELLDHELALVEQLKFADYFLTVFDIVAWARSKQILCQGRGSAANSAICFVLGITALDPTQFDLLFERFISVERGDPPDIDVDFEHERREEVIQYIYTRYGRHRAAMVCNVICFKSRGALRAAGEALGISPQLIDSVSTRLNSRSLRESGTHAILDGVRQEFPDMLSPHHWTLWAKITDALRGIPRHLGIHSGGFVISQHPMTSISPIEPATMTDRTVIQWNKDDIESLGFFKIDILALGGLTLIRKCLDSIHTHDGIALSMDRIPPNDPATFDMICAADTVGTFQIESRAQMAFLPRHQPRHFYDLVVQVAIIRPGPIQGGMIHPYLRRRRGEEAISFPDPRLIPILQRTFGVPIFQEQIMRIAIAVGGFTPGEADELRKHIGAFSLNLNQSHWIKRLHAGMTSNGIHHEFIDRIIQHIQGFASYGFPESHAASFALLAYITAYLKCHFPAHFFVSILNSLPMGFYSPDVLIKTAQRAGVTVTPICIRQSHWDHTLEKTNGQWTIRLGFRLVRGIRETTIRQLEIYRQNPLHPVIHSTPTLISALNTIRFNAVDISALAAANAFQSIGIERRDAIWLADAHPIREILDPLGPAPDIDPEHPLVAVQLDYEATQTSLGHHPSALIRQYAWPYAFSSQWLTFKSDIVRGTIAPGKTITVFGMVTVRQSPPTAKGVVFITLWDEHGSYDLIIRPEIYQNYRQVIDRESFLCAKGVLQHRDGTWSIRVTSVLDSRIPKRKSIVFPDSTTECDTIRQTM
ncbi:DNA polymerase III subunit alpha [bacterium]|nr:DNA polymerase III subunit alpha [bacterium]